MSRAAVVVAGSIAIDRIMSFGGQYADYIRPEKLDSLSVSIFLDTLKDTYGGVGANIAYNLALLGDEPFLLGSVGADGVAYLEKLAHNGVNIKYVHESALPTSSFNVISDGVQNQVAGFYPGAMTDSSSLTLEPWKDTKAIVVVAPHDPAAMRRQVAEAKRWSLRLCYDVGQQVNNLGADDLLDGLKAAEVVLVNEYELEVLSHKTGLSTEDIYKLVPVVVTTLGSQGSLLKGSNISKAITVGIAKPEKVADPTGAGDAYRGGFFYGYSRNWPLAVCAQLGAVCASYALESLGTQAHTFTIDTVRERYETTFGESLPNN